MSCYDEGDDIIIHTPKVITILFEQDFSVHLFPQS